MQGLWTSCLACFDEAEAQCKLWVDGCSTCVCCLFALSQNRVNLQDEDVIRLLHSLSCAKYKILLKEPASKNISKSDTFK